MPEDPYNTGVSDHAIVRFLERKYGMDIDSIKKEILPDHMREMVKAGAEKYHIGNFEFRVRNSVVTTCVEKSCERTDLRDSKTKTHITNKKHKNNNWHQTKKYSKKIKRNKW